ncbi:phytoene synthase [Parafrankia irregularis]|uniref:Phytoene synthase n=1 Tax=Parafrankia irregularis TaxID=795642 RepID=A0A0S4QLL9_9ACTN|nr:MULTISPECIES: phytoene/squalene synthase family protein [Parafrankia]MBE3201994.1 phytoene/squalene synthase family protein [Parafrankia sp. CH37]CUU55768.1 phytoene synthase [Parafrankia irregularis]
MGGLRGELDAAGVTDERLRASYRRARELNAAHGRTYYLATLLLPKWKRPHVHALYGFARYADEIVDDLDSTLTDEAKAQWLRRWGDTLLASLASGAEADADATVLPAVLHTIRRFDLPVGYFETFLASMAMDLTITSYATWDDLMVYIHGSAVVIGLQMLPILEPVNPAAEPYARDLGIAFQLANFIRDIGEDLRRGRVYLPQSSLDLFGVTWDHLATGVADGPVRRLLAFEIARARELFRSARPGIRLLHPTSRDCVSTAFQLYSGILDEVERADYQILDRRVSVGLGRRLSVAAPGLVRAAYSRRDRAAGENRAPDQHRAPGQSRARPPR